MNVLLSINLVRGRGEFGCAWPWLARSRKFQADRRDISGGRELVSLSPCRIAFDALAEFTLFGGGERFPPPRPNGDQANVRASKARSAFSQKQLAPREFRAGRVVIGFASII